MNLTNWLFGPPTQDQFARAMMKALRQAGDRRQLKYEPAEFRLTHSNRGEINLGNLYAEHCQLPWGERQTHLKRLAQTFLAAEEDLPDSFDEARPNLRPKIWTRAMYLSMDRRQRQSNGKPFDMPSYPLGSHLLTTIVYDLPTSMRSISSENLSDWGVTYYEAMEAACENLSESSTAYSKIGEGFYSAISCDSYDSSRILLKSKIDLWDVSGDYVAMIPQRDAMYVTGSEDEVGLSIMIGLAEQTLKDQPRPLSPVPLRLVDGEWEDWTIPRSHPLYSKYRQMEDQFLAGLYSEQKSQLDETHEREGIDVFVATFSGVKRESTDEILSYCVWSKDVVSWLPKTELIMFHSGVETIPCRWDKVVEVAGDLLEPFIDLYPIRYRVVDFPTPEQLNEIGTVEL